MKMNYTRLSIIIFLTLLMTIHSYGQTPAPGTPPPANNTFDVIIKKNGDLVYGLVKEVGLYLIKYQRTDIPDGPIYTIPRSEVYAISYRNQVKDILSPVEGTVFDNGANHIPDRYNPPALKNVDRFSFQHGDARIALGFIRSYTKVKNANEYSSSGGFPVISLAYDVPYRNQLRLGLQLSFGSHKFARQEYSDYDSTKSDVHIKENIFTLYAYGKYTAANSYARWQPYLLAGLGINSSNIHTDYAINFINDPGKVLLVKSGARSVGLGLLARVGTDFYINNQVRIFGDVGIGASVLQVGVAVNTF